MKIIADRDIKYVKFTGWLLIVLAVMGLLLKGLQVKRQTFELVLGQTGLLGVLLLISLGRLGELAEDFKKTRKTTPVFILAGLLLSWAIMWYREIIARRYGMAVAPGTGQVHVPNLDVINADTVIITASIIVLGPLLEEILFRFIGLGLVRRLARPGQAALFIGIWIIITSVMFALLHNPEPAALAVYLISSVSYSVIYLRYGIFASILMHAAGNAGVYII
ncbi:CPBP family glutamic-type intramembrane protease [Desulfoscipio sp. XC116]|uniref:CPBP family intramembrane glutamic endopeptidase n=1 Tax=Desulfoscipio sp. XC116 TaxID=3144975 RepID=UPI00325B7DFE